MTLPAAHLPRRQRAMLRYEPEAPHAAVMVVDVASVPHAASRATGAVEC